MSDDRVGTLRVLKGQSACVRLALGCSATGGVQVSTSLFVQPELWPGRLIGEWTAQEHQQLAMGITRYGHDWPSIQRMMVPSRSAKEVRMP